MATNDRRRSTWLNVSDQEWAVIMFMRAYLDRWKSPPAFYDLALKVHGHKVRGKLEPDQLFELDMDADTMIIDGVSRRIERRAVLVDGETRIVQCPPA